MGTDFAKLDSLTPLDPEELFRQWVLSPDGADYPTGWDRRSFRGWQLCSHQDAHICTLVSRDGTMVGWVMEPLAYLSDDGGIVPKKRLQLPVDAHDSPTAFERALYGRDVRGHSNGTGLAGTWVAIVFGGAPGGVFQRVYLAASHSVVYHPQKRRVATTHNLIPGIRRNMPLSHAFDCLATDSYFSFGLTPFEGLHRLLPNHYLDLDTFAPVRHWPVCSMPRLATGEEGAASVVNHARSLIRVLSTAYNSFCLMLSAGHDSRAILATLRPFAEEGVDISLRTSGGDDIFSRTDIQGARRLAQIVDLPHEVMSTKEHSEGEVDRMRGFVRIGEATAGPLLLNPGIHVRDAFDPNAPFTLAGMGGETGRAFYWADGLPPNITPKVLAQKVEAPLTETVLAAADWWLKGLPEDVRQNRADVLDLAYIEQRMGCWQAPATYLFGCMANPDGLSRRVTSPMAETFSYEMMLRLPRTYKRSGAIQRDMVASGWPELLEVPFNQPTGMLYLRHTVVQAILSPVYKARVFVGAWRRRLWN